MITVIEFLEITERPRLKEFKDHASLAEIYSQLLNFNLNDPTLNTPSLICITNLPVYSQLNLAKAKAVQAVNLILDHLFENRKTLLEAEGKIVDTQIGLDMPDTPLVNIFFSLVEPITHSLHTLACLDNFHTVIQLNSVSELLIELFSLLHKLTRENKFNHFFGEHYRNIIVEICLVFLQVTPLDLEELEESPNEFIHKSIELCDRSESVNLKTTVAQFFEALCDYIDGAVAFTVNFCKELTELGLVGNDSEVAYLLPYQNAKIVKTDPQILAETGLLALGVISFIVCRRHDLLKVLELFLKRIWDSVVVINSPLVQQRLCLFIQFYTGKLFLNDYHWLTKLVQLVIEYNMPLAEARARNLQAAITINHFFTEEAIAYRLERILPSTFDRLVCLIPVQKDIQFFDALQEILTCNFHLALDFLEQLVSNLAKKIYDLAMEIKKNSKKRKKLTSFIIKCWNIIRHIGANNTVTKEQILLMENTLLPVFEFIQYPGSIDFDDDILLFEVSLIRKCQCVTQIGWTIFQHLTKVQDKYGGTFLQLFPIINCYVHFGRETLLSNSQTLQNLVDMCGKCLSAVHKNKPNEAANAEGALILQQILHSFRGQIDFLVEAILRYALQRLFQPINYAFFKIRLLGIIFSAICYNPTKILELLTNQPLDNGNCLDFCIRQLYDVSPMIKSAYDRKVTTFGLVELIKILPFSELTCNLFILVINVLMTYETEHGISNLSKLEAQLRQLSAEGVHMGGDSLKASTLTTLSKTFKAEEIEAELALTTYLTPLTEQNEFNYFREFIQYAQLNSPQTLKDIIGRLEPQQVKNLGILIRSKEVKVNLGEQVGTEIRRPVKPKRH